MALWSVGALNVERWNHSVVDGRRKMMSPAEAREPASTKRTGRRSVIGPLRDLFLPNHHHHDKALQLLNCLILS